MIEAEVMIMNPNATAEVDSRVEQRDLANQEETPFPPVFATARMVRLMEMAAARCLEPLLGAGELSVGVAVDVEHTAATPLGARVRARAQFVEQKGKLFWFEISAHDEGGPIGKGRHARAIVRVDRLLDGAARRNAAGT
jgi:predicted thioesterase